MPCLSSFPALCCFCRATMVSSVEPAPPPCFHHTLHIIVTASAVLVPLQLSVLLPISPLTLTSFSHQVSLRFILICSRLQITFLILGSSESNSEAGGTIAVSWPSMRGKGRRPRPKEENNQVESLLALQRQ